MCEIRDVRLDIPTYPVLGGAGEATVVVQAALAFSREEIGKTAELRIELFGEDLPGDRGPQWRGNRLMYTFRFGEVRRHGKHMILPSDVKLIVATGAEYPISEQRLIPAMFLDEDPGPEFIPGPSGLIWRVNRDDEIYARVTLTCGSRSHTARSAPARLTYAKTLARAPQEKQFPTGVFPHADEAAVSVKR